MGCGWRRPGASLSNTPTTKFCAFDYVTTIEIVPENKRDSFFGKATVKATDNINVFAQYVRGYNHQFQYNGQRGYFLGNPQGTITIYRGNAFLPTNVQQIMTANNIPSFTLRRVGSFEDVGHYTQLMWRATGRVGCAVADGRAYEVLVCRYREAGNVEGERPF